MTSKPIAATPAAPNALRPYLLSPTFWLVGLFIVLLMGVTAALPPHMVSLLRENGLPETWVIAVPAAIGVLQLLGRLLLYFFLFGAMLVLWQEEQRITAAQQPRPAMA